MPDLSPDQWALLGCLFFVLSITGAVLLLVRELRAGRG